MFFVQTRSEYFISSSLYNYCFASTAWLCRCAWSTVRRHIHVHYYYYYYQPIYLLSIYLALDPEGCRGTTDDLSTSCLHVFHSLLCNTGKSSHVHSVMLSSSSSCSPHSALQDGLCQAGWLGDVSVPLQLQIGPKTKNNNEALGQVPKCACWIIHTIAYMLCW